MQLDGTHHLTLTVTDLDRTCEWYRTVLGFRDIVRYRNDAIGAECHVLSHPGAARPTIGLRQYDAGANEVFDEHRVGLDHVAFEATEAALVEWQAHFDALGVEYTTTRIPELSIVVTRDPDNIQIELCATNPSPVGSAIGSDGRIILPTNE